MHLPPAACMARQFVLAIAEVWWPVQEGQWAVHCPVVVNACLSAKECHQGVVVLQLVVEVGDEYQGGLLQQAMAAVSPRRKLTRAVGRMCSAAHAARRRWVQSFEEGLSGGAHPQSLSHSLSDWVAAPGVRICQ